MVVNFRACGISRGARKLARTFTLNYIYISALEHANTCIQSRIKANNQSFLATGIESLPIICHPHRSQHLLLQGTFNGGYADVGIGIKLFLKIIFILKCIKIIYFLIFYYLFQFCFTFYYLVYLKANFYYFIQFFLFFSFM